MTISNIILKNLIPEPKYGNISPLGNTAAFFRDGFRGDYTLVVPHLAFTDLVSGPSSGLGDGLGDGTIVTVWGWGFGDSQGSVFFTDNLGVERQAAHIYYWKKADGVAPSGPANLWESHAMYEVAFSIPSGSANGLGSIHIVKQGGASSDNTLPFTVRAGRIFYTASTGNNANAGTWASPKAFINGNITPSASTAFGNANLIAGDIVYSRGVAEPVFSSGGIGAGMYLRSLSGTAAEHVAIVAYPGSHSTVISTNRGVNPYLSSGIALSKWLVGVGHQDDPIEPINAGQPDASNYHIGMTTNGRVVGNKMVQNAGKIFNGWSGAITSGGDSLENSVVAGNEIFSIGGDTTSHFAHTTYFSVRSPTSELTTGFECAYNYLHDNKAKFGIHVYDESYSGGCGIFTGLINIHHNVVVDQKGTGINVSTRDLSEVDGICWATDISVCQNLLINVGLGPVAELNNGTAPYGISVGGDINAPSVLIDGNTLFGFSDASSRIYATAHGLSISFSSKVNPPITVKNNLFWNSVDVSWLSNTKTGTTTLSNNAYFNTAGYITAVVPAGQITTDPICNPVGSRMAVRDTSPLIGNGISKTFSRNIYGQVQNNIGAV